MLRRLPTLLFLFAIVAGPTALRAQDPVLHALEALDTALSREEGLSEETRQAMRALVEGLRAERRDGPPAKAMEDAIAKAIEEALPSGAGAPAKGKLEGLLSKLSLSGDLRLRHESNLNRSAGADRDRQRVRFRLGLGVKVNDELSIGVRFVTGDPDDPNSPHHTLGTVFNKLDLSLDRVHITYKPEWAEGVEVLAGKFGNPFHKNPVYGELVWDADVQPEGALIKWKHTDEDGVFSAISAQIGAFNLLERGGGDDAAIWAAQLAGTVPLDDDIVLDLSSAYYHVGNTSPGGSSAILGDNAGNRLVDTSGNGMVDAYLSDFGVLDTVAALKFSWDGRPVVLATEAIWNLRADEGRDFGWSVGASVGNAGKAGDFRAYYAYQVVAQDAVFSPVAQDDFILQTNHRSHLLGANYMLDDGVGLHLWALASTPDATPAGSSDETRFRIRLDLNLSF